MMNASLVRLVLLRSPPFAAICGSGRNFISVVHQWQHHYATNAAATDAETEEKIEKKKGEWFTLPPFTSTVDGAALGKELFGRGSGTNSAIANTMPALKWVLRCCPQLPRSLVQKLFRLRQVRRQSSDIVSSNLGVQEQDCRPRRVSAKDLMNFGDRIYLPITVKELRSQKADCLCTEEEVKFLHSLELYKDAAIIVVNKPSGMPVQGGIGIKRSLDELAANFLRYDCSEPPRLVHRLDRDSSGILVLGRTQLSATILHSIFHEKTFGASTNDLDNKKRILQRRYWALVIGSPRRPQGLISVPLGKVVVDNGKSERITVIDNVQTVPSQHSITEYRVIGSSCHGYTWLELSPLTGRKHQLRVHCAEVLGTPIVGDYKYGWQAHRKWKHFPYSNQNLNEKLPKGNTFPFGLDLENGSISEKQPQLHLHCKEMDLPDVCLALQHTRLSSECDLMDLESLKLVAPLPFHMQKSWDLLHS
ncbi:RNA pseudouridine synthase 4, mitochondrial [Cornus florida]|uniref:RNA pseudouridine synthase 4, mitochondrial n=1 Tax=Cornus florida TaxID=4283 RepID=UPI00289DAE1E|nr:RNA pseudouridine synthase 4, mitochondrial [Cornus florida]XP_059647832.1 RNA pseudouridine synthase 4, mitochondrial [Cornus florida]